MLIYFIRHGQTEDNRNGIIQGHIDTHLNDHGRTEAAAAGRGLRSIRFDEVWSSSLSRAVETATIITSHNTASPPSEIHTDAGLKERYLGGLQGKTRGYGQALPEDVEPTDEFRQRIATWLTTFLSSHLPLPVTSAQSSGPNPSSTLSRTPNTSSASFTNDRNQNQHSMPPTPEEYERTALVVSHGAYMKALLHVLTHPSFGFAFDVKEGVDVREQCWNTSIMRVRVRVQDTAGETAENGQRGEARWKGKVLSWGDVRHLEQEGEWEDVGVADDV